MKIFAGEGNVRANPVNRCDKICGKPTKNILFKIFLRAFNEKIIVSRSIPGKLRTYRVQRSYEPIRSYISSYLNVFMSPSEYKMVVAINSINMLCSNCICQLEVWVVVS